MKVTIYYSETMNTVDPDDFNVYQGVESVVMHQSGCIHLSSERDRLIDGSHWESVDDWAWVAWEDDSGAEVAIHNKTEI